MIRNSFVNNALLINEGSHSTMKATVYEKPGDVELKDVPKPEIKTANDAII